MRSWIGIIFHLPAFWVLCQSENMLYVDKNLGKVHIQASSL